MTDPRPDREPGTKDGTMIRICFAATAAFLVVGAGCGSPDTDVPRVEAAHEEPAAATAGGEEGTIRIGGTTYAFDVLACDVSGETDDDMYQTLSGRGTTPEGERFQVTVSRNDVAGMLVHTVSFAAGDVLRGEGTVREAQRMRHGQQWSSTFDGPAEPLIRIDSNRVTASGLFGSPDGSEAASEPGSLEARC
jgi:hypothetical protein